jgi:hypothetical protein
MSASTGRARLLDHAVLPVADLATARERLTELGFTVAPDGQHPFGTANCCVYFADGTFLEPLAVADRDKASAAAQAGNVFTARDEAYRRTVGDDGFSALVMATGDAQADHAAFVERGFSAGPMLEFSRPFVDASGANDHASFRLAFAADAHARGAFFFSCQRLNTPKVDRSALQIHANGVSRIVKVLLGAEEPQAYADLLSAIAGSSRSTAVAGGIEIEAANGAIVVLTPAKLLEELGVEAFADPSLRLVGLVFGIAGLPQTEALLRAGRVSHKRLGGRLIVQPAPGQGAIFAFEEKQ